MTSKNKTKLYITLFYIETLNLGKNTRVSLLQPSVFSLERSGYTKFGNTGRFFKKLAFLGLAYNNVVLSKGHTMTLKSAMLVVWNAIATYTFIF